MDFESKLRGADICLFVNAPNPMPQLLKSFDKFILVLFIFYLSFILIKKKLIAV